MRRKNSWKYLGVIIVLGIALPIGWWLLSPLWTNVEVNEALPTSAPPAASEPTDQVQVESTQIAAPPDTGITTLAQGTFYNVAHIGSGQAGVHQLADGSRVLRFENFQVENGPDLYVYLVPVDPVPNVSGSEIPGSVNLGRLKGNIGDQNYDIPADLDLSQYKSVVIWCQAFAVPFSAAPLDMQ